MSRMGIKWKVLAVFFKAEKKIFLIKLSQEGLTDRKSMYAQIQEIQKYQGLETF